MKIGRPRGKRLAPVFRVVLVIGVATLSYASVRRSLAWSLLRQNPETAYALAPSDAQILASWSSITFDFGENPKKRHRAVSAALAALDRNPIAVPAIMTLALDSETNGDHARAVKLSRYAETLSRRDLKTELFLLQSAVDVGDINEAMRHYDLALRTSEAAPALLFPILLTAVSHPEVRSALVRTLSSHPAWFNVFLYDLVNNSPDLPAAAQLLAHLRENHNPAPIDAEDILISRLVAQSQIGVAWSYYRLRDPSADSNLIRNGGFAEQKYSTPFDWVFPETMGVSASLDRGGDHSFLSFHVAPMVGGVVARQLLRLNGGTHLLSGHGTLSGDAPDQVATWTLRCGDGRLLATLPLPKAKSSQTRLQAIAIVPTGCESQWLELFVRPAETVEGITGRADDIIAL